MCFWSGHLVSQLAHFFTHLLINISGYVQRLPRILVNARSQRLPRTVFLLIIGRMQIAEVASCLYNSGEVQRSSHVLCSDHV
jgi:hypothetical protein